MSKVVCTYNFENLRERSSDLKWFVSNLARQWGKQPGQFLLCMQRKLVKWWISGTASISYCHKTHYGYVWRRRKPHHLRVVSGFSHEKWDWLTWAEQKSNSGIFRHWISQAYVCLNINSIFTIIVLKAAQTPAWRTKYKMYIFVMFKLSQICLMQKWE